MTAKLRAVTCGFCSASVSWEPTMVRSDDYRKAFADATRKATEPLVSLRGNAYAIGDRIGRGGACDVYDAARIHRIGERIILKIVREPRDTDLIERERSILTQLHERGAHPLVPVAVGIAKVSGGDHDGKPALLLRFPPGFAYTLPAIQAASGPVMDPRHAVWILRRTLSLLAVLHAQGVVHGAVLPDHILVHPGNHGALLCAYVAAAKPGAPIDLVDPAREKFYPSLVATPSLDIVMAARSVCWLLGSPEPRTAPAQVPAPLATLLGELAEGRWGDARDASQRVADAAKTVYGPPRFVRLDLGMD